MKYKKAINRPNGEAQKQEVEREHEQMIKYKVWRPIKKNQVPKGSRIIGLTWYSP